MWMDTETFQTVVASTPLISIDLVIENEQGEILLGLRTNRPAQGFWFVPGGRIHKNETLDEAFRRLTAEELGLMLERSSAQFLGVYEHFYDDSVFGCVGEAPDTHYVVLSYQLRIDQLQLRTLPLKQHRDYRWWPKAEMQTTAAVHANSRAYLNELK